MGVQYDDLVDEQKDIIEEDEHDVIVLAGAGTGKTTAALWAARRELERQDVAGCSPTARVLMLTFSRTATMRVLERAGAILSGDANARVEIHTFHGFAYRVIRDFGRYVGMGTELPVLKSAAELKLFGYSPGSIEYNDLLPLALRILEKPAIAQLLLRRWSMVICDEFQDTSDVQWELLERLTSHARLMLLGDPNQRIYDFVPGVGAHRIAVARARRGILEKPLPAASHRDPTQVLPAAAEAILRRAFDDPAIAEAIRSGRLEIRAPVEISNGCEVIAAELRGLRRTVGGSIGVYVRENLFVRDLCAELTEMGVSHTPVGLSEAHAHALVAQATIISACLGEATWLDVCRELAIYLTANTRGRNAPPAANSLARGVADSATLMARLASLQGAIEQPSHTVGSAAEVAARSWLELAIGAGSQNWRRATQVLYPMLDRIGRDATSSGNLARQIQSAKSSVLTSAEDEVLSSIQVMTMHQTKGRESNSTVVWVRADDFHGPDSEWPERGPRLLYVALTRARKKVVVLMPADPHPLWSPLLAHTTRSGDPEEG